MNESQLINKNLTPGIEKITYEFRNISKRPETPIVIVISIHPPGETNFSSAKLKEKKHTNQNMIHKYLYATN